MFTLNSSGWWHRKVLHVYCRSYRFIREYTPACPSSPCQLFLHAHARVWRLPQDDQIVRDWVKIAWIVFDKKQNVLQYLFLNRKRCIRVLFKAAKWTYIFSSWWNIFYFRNNIHLFLLRSKNILKAYFSVALSTIYFMAEQNKYSKLILIFEHPLSRYQPKMLCAPTSHGIAFVLMPSQFSQRTLLYIYI